METLKELLNADLKLAGALKCTDAQITDPLLSERERERN